MHTLLGIVHILLFISYCSYIFWRVLIPNPKVFDTLYLYSVLIIILSWLVCNDECIITIIYKKLKNKANDASDLEDLLGANKHWVGHILVTSIFITSLFLLSIYKVNSIPVICMFIFVFVYLRLTKSEHKQKLEFVTIKFIIAMIIVVNIVIFAKSL